MSDFQKENRAPNAIQKVFRMRGVGQVIIVTGFLAILLVVFQISNGNFLTIKNFPNLLRQIAPLLIIGIGQSYVLITGNIDLSIGSNAGMSCMIAASLMVLYGTNPWIAALIAIAACLVSGLINGVLVANFKLPPFIATLGTMTIARGVAMLAYGGSNTLSIETGLAKHNELSQAAVDAYQLKAQAFRNFFYYGKINLGRLGFIYYGFIIALVLLVIFFFILSATSTGRHIYAVGSNIEAAKMSGVSVPKATITAYLVSGFCAGVVGLMLCANSGQGDQAAGNSYELYAVAASVIGGVSTLGGQGVLLGTLVGASIWATLSNGLSLAHVEVALQNIIVGAIVVVSVLIDVLIRRRRR